MTEQLVNQTSSIGISWPPAEFSHNRLRGIFDEGVIRTQTDAADYAEEFSNWQTELADRPQDRLSIRVIASAGALAAMDSMDVWIEAAVPLADEDGLVLAYTGWNEPERRVSEEQISCHRHLLSAATARGLDVGDKYRQLSAQGFIPRIIDSRTPEIVKESLVPRFAEMYAAFEYDEAAVEELLMNPDNTIAYICDGERIISTSMAESASVAINGIRAIRLVEITEASTHPDYRKRGLYKAVSGYLLQRLMEEFSAGRHISALYGESNLAMPGVVYAAYENGRHFSCFDGPAYGINRPDFGILPQNFRVNDGIEQRPYNDFAVSYLPLA